MKRFKALYLICIFLILANSVFAQIGFYDAPYTRYEADLGTLANASILGKSYDQSLLQSEASDQICVTLQNNTSASVSWPVSADGDGLVVRYSIPDGSSAALTVFANGVNVGTLNLTTYYSWEMLMGNPNPNDAGITNGNWKMRFDEVRLKLPSKVLTGQTLKLVYQSGNNITIDFAELEPVPAAVTASGGDVTYDNSGLQSFVNAHGGQSIFLPAGTYNINSTLWFGANNTTLKGAGMWYTEIHFTNTGSSNQAGLWGQASNINFSGLYLSTTGNSRSNNSKGINGVPASVTNVWVEHFECGAWIAQYNSPSGPSFANGLNISYCRFRDNYADGTNLCEGTSNAVVQHCSYRNNGDDDMAVWPATGSGQEGQGNTFQYNTAENSWRASGCAIYGGLNNKAQYLLIKDNQEAGLRAGNNFGGYAFNGGGMHTFSNIRVVSGGTYHDLFNKPVGAIDLLNCGTCGAGNVVQNVTFSCIELINSKNDAINMNVQNSGSGFNNMHFDNITINGTGAEYPNNGGAVAGRGYGFIIRNSPGGSGNYCNITYANLAGNGFSNTSWGGYNLTVEGTCPGGCVPLVTSTASTTITSPSNWSSFNGCPPGAIAITATSNVPSGNTVNYIEFFVDGVSVGTDNSSPYSGTWSSPTDGSHVLTAVSHYSGGSTTTSSNTIIDVGGIKQTATPAIIDGVAEPLWSGFGAFNLTQGYNNAPNLAAKYKIIYDATYVYLLVTVTDNTPFAPNSPATLANYWNDDGIEVYFDCGNSKQLTYNSTDFQYAMMRDAANSTLILETKHSPGSLTGVSGKMTTTATGYIVEMKFPWTTLGCIPTAGTILGFDIDVNDNATGGASRSNELGWYDGTFSEWGNPSLFGTLQFSACGSLPVNLLTFTGDKTNETIVLNWSTASEKNNSKFVIERSNNLSTWESIGEVAGSGNSTSVVKYGFTDYAPLQTDTYYRLKQIDLNGQFAYSSAIEIRYDKQTTGISVAPNPFDDALTILSSLKGDMNISIHDVLGRLLYQTNLKNDEGTLIIHPDLSSGAYVITIQNGAFVERQKVVKK